MENIQKIEIELKSEAMNEMLSRPPSWLVRSGSSVLILIIILIIGLCFLIEYPDEIIGESILTSENPPIELKNQLNVQLKKLLIEDGHTVHQGELIAEFETNTKSSDIDTLSNYLFGLSKLKLIENTILPELKNTLELGSLNDSWYSFRSKIIDWNSNVTNNIQKEQLYSLQREITYRERLETISKRKMDLSEKEFTALEKELKSSERLAEQQIISKQAFNLDFRNLTAVQQNVQTQKEQYVQNLIQLNSLRKELSQLKVENELKKSQQIEGIENSIKSLNNQIIEWRKNAVWLAPTDGKVYFNKQLNLNSFYNPGEASIIVVPRGSKNVAKVTISQDGASKVKINQKCILELLDYPKAEFGTIEGTVVYITKIEKDGKYEVLIKLPQKIKTSYNKNIKLTTQLKGNARIITKNKRLFFRFFEKFTDLIK